MRKKIVISYSDKPIVVKVANTGNSNKLVSLLEEANTQLLGGKGVSLEATLPNGKKVKCYLDGAAGDKLFIN